jgi:probable HAF family extracellular repeat protein
MNLRIATLFPTVSTVVLALGIIGLSSSSLRSEPPTAIADRGYQLTDLGTLGGASSGATGVDEDGAVVGWSLTDAGARRAFIWHDASGLDQLGTLQNGSYSSADALSDHGEWIAGNSGIRPSLDPEMFADINQGFSWNGGSMQSVGAFYNPATPNRRFGTSEAHGVNDLGQVVGFSNVQRQNLQSAFLWEDGVLKDIGHATESVTNTRAFDINNAGQVVGDIIAGGSSGDSQAFVWQGDEFQNLPTADGYAFSTAIAVNEDGDAVGWSGNESITSAVRWSNGIVEDIGVLPGDESSRALDVNDMGQVVGSSGSAAATRAFIWESGAMTDLNSLLAPDSGWTLTEAAGINNQGAIVGSGLKNGQPRAFLLKPAPPTPQPPPAEPPPFSCGQPARMSGL